MPNVQNDVHVSESEKSDDREKDQHSETCGSDHCVDFESLAFHIPLLNKWKQIAKKNFDD